MQIWVDADACPGEIKELLYRAANAAKSRLRLSPISRCGSRPPLYRHPARRAGDEHRRSTHCRTRFARRSGHYGRYSAGRRRGGQGGPGAQSPRRTVYRCQCRRARGGPQSGRRATWRRPGYGWTGGVQPQRPTRRSPTGSTVGWPRRNERGRAAAQVRSALENVRWGGNHGEVADVDWYVTGSACPPLVAFPPCSRFCPGSHNDASTLAARHRYADFVCVGIRSPWAKRPGPSSVAPMATDTPTRRICRSLGARRKTSFGKCRSTTAAGRRH